MTFFNPHVQVVSYLQIEGLTKSYGDRLLFADVTFGIYEGDKVGIIAPNGTGKSTLLSIIAGTEEADSGSVIFRNGLRVGFLAQTPQFAPSQTLLSYVAAGAPADPHSETDPQTAALSLIGSMRLPSPDSLMGSLSGGEAKRASLARLLLGEPDMLLLDEPTNHLDIESIIWLEDFLNKFPGGVVLVSHDRTFLDNVTNRTIEISGGRIYDYKQPYSKFLELRQEIREKQIATRKNQENEIKQTKQLIERFRYKATKAAFAQSLMKRLEKTELIEVDTDDVAAMNLKFQVDSPTGKVVFRAENVCKTFDDTYRKIDRDGHEIEVKYEPKQVLRGINLEVERGDKIAFVGKNGQGKTTFVRCLLGQINYQGTIEKGHNVHLGYYAQNQKESLDLEKTLIQTIEDEATEAMRPKARDLLGSFLFSGDAIDKKVKVLSGGERGRIALCKLLVRPFNVLLMDEPTNHLDIRSKAILKEALKSFDGTLILVSHDRDFLNGLTNKVYEFRGGYAKEYLGDINFYLEQRKVDSFREMELERTDEKTASVHQSPASKGQPKKENLSFTEKKELEKEIRRLTSKVSKLEGEIEETERLIASMDQLFAEAGYTHSDEDFVKYQELKRSLDEKMTAWEQAQEELSSAQGRL